MKYLYHGSYVSGIQELKANSKLHDTEQNVVYLTDNIPYALFYIWDAEYNGMLGKYVTGWLKDGIAYYEEQFPEQLKTLYQGVCGYLYHIAMTSNFQKVAGHANTFYSPEDCEVAKEEYIEDVYEELLKYEAMGQMKVLRYNEQTQDRKQALHEKMVMGFQRANFYQENEAKAVFMKKHFPKAWAEAEVSQQISIRPIQSGEQDLFDDTEYETMSAAEKDQMIAESLAKNHNGRYFEFFVVESGGNCVGFMSLYAHSETMISCGPEIKRHSRKKGYGYLGERLILDYAKSIGYTEAIAQVRVENTASRALHEKLGFTLQKTYVNQKGREVCEYRKEL